VLLSSFSPQRGGAELQTLQRCRRLGWPRCPLFTSLEYSLTEGHASSHVSPPFKLQARAQGSKVTALSSVVAGKEVESDAIVLHRGLERESLYHSLTDLFLFFFLFYNVVCVVYVQPTAPFN